MIIGLTIFFIIIICETLLLVSLWINETRLVNENCKLEVEKEKLQSILFTIGEMAVSSFDNSIVGLVDRTLPKGFMIPKEEHNKNLELLKKEKGCNNCFYFDYSTQSETCSKCTSQNNWKPKNNES